MPATDETGKDYKYTAEEILSGEDWEESYVITSKEVTGGVEITNRLKDETSLQVMKEWEDNDNASGLRPGTITVHLYRLTNGDSSTLVNMGYVSEESTDVEVKGAEYPIVLSALNSWQASFTGLVAHEGNNTYEYFVTEDPVQSYSTTYAEDYSKDELVGGSADEDGIVTITNTLDTFQATKKWLDKDDNETWVADVTFKLVKVLADGSFETNIPKPQYYVENDLDWSQTITTNTDNRTAVWDHLDPLEDGQSYFAIEWEIAGLEHNDIVRNTQGAALQFELNGTIYEVTGGVSTDGTGTIVNAPRVNKEFKKTWVNTDDKTDLSIQIQLRRKNKATGRYDEEFNNNAELYPEGQIITLTADNSGTVYTVAGAGISDASETEPAASATGDQWTYTWRNLPITVWSEENAESIEYIYEVKEIKVLQGTDDVTEFFSKNQTDLMSITNTREVVDVPISKTWDDFTGDDYTWTATFQIEYIERLIEGLGEDQSVTTWTDIGAPVTISKNSTEEERTVADLPKYRISENGNVYERIYSATETAYEVKQGETVVYSFDGTTYYPEGTEYAANFDHDANENLDGDYEIRVHNSEAEHEQGSTVDISIEKIWEGNDADIKAAEGTYAKFVLKRYFHEEYVDWTGIDPDADDITITLVVGDDTRTFTAKPGQQLWAIATFAAKDAGNVGVVRFTKDNAYHEEVTTLTHYYSNNAELVRSAPFILTEDTTIICSNANGFADGADGVQITTRSEGTTPQLDAGYAEEFTLEKGVWSKSWEKLDREVSRMSGTQETIRIYGYYFEEIESNPEGFIAKFAKKGTNQKIDQNNRIYLDTDVTATNEALTEFKVHKTWWNAEDKDMPGIIYELYRQNRDNGGNPQGSPILIGTYMLNEDGGFELNTETNLISDNEQISETPWTMSHYVNTDEGEPKYYFTVKETGIYVPAEEGTNAGKWSVGETSNTYVKIENSANPGKDGDTNWKDGRSSWGDARLDLWRGSSSDTPQLTIRNTMYPYVNQIHLIKRWRDFNSSGGVRDIRNPNYEIKIQLVRRIVREDTDEVIESKVYGYPVTLKHEGATYTVETEEPTGGTFSHDLGENDWGEWFTDGNGEWHYLQHNTEAEALPHYGYYYDDEGNPFVARYEYTFVETEARCDFDGDGVYETNWIERILWDGDSTHSQDSTVYLMDNFKTSKIILRKKWYGTVDADHVLFSIIDDHGNDWGEIIHNYIDVGGRDYSFFGLEEKNLINYNDHWYIAVYPDQLDSDGNWTLTVEGIPYLWVDNNADECHEQEYDVRETFIHEGDSYRAVTPQENILYTSWYRGTIKADPQLSNEHAHVQMGRDDENRVEETTTTVIVSNVTDTELEVNKEWLDENGELIDTSSGTTPTITVDGKEYTVDKVEYVLKVTTGNHDGSGDPSSAGYSTTGYLTGSYSEGTVTANLSTTEGLILSGNTAGALKISLTAGAENDWTQIIKGLPSAHIYDRGSGASSVRFYTETFEYEVEEYKVYGSGDGQSDVDITKYFTKADPEKTPAATQEDYDSWKLSNKVEETGSVKVTKTFSGLNELPEDFMITATWTAADGNEETKELTVDNADSGDGLTTPYTWVIDNLPIGNTVTFVESGYEVEGYIITVNSVAIADDMTADAKSAAVTRTAVSTDGDVEETATAQAAFENAYTPNNVDLEITKEVTGTDDKTKEFTFVVTLTPPTGVTLSNSYSATLDGVETDNVSVTPDLNDDEEPTGTYTVSDIKVKADETFKIIGLPAGITYSVAEKDIPGGYSEGTHEDATGTISEGSATATMKNTYSAEGKVTFNVKKSFKYGDLTTKTFTFKLTQVTAENSSTQATENVKLSTPITVSTSTEGDSAEQTVSFDEVTGFDLDDVGTEFWFMIEEVPGDDVSVDYDGSKFWVKVTFADAGDGTLTPTKIPDAAIDASFENEQLTSFEGEKIWLNGDGEDMAPEDGTVIKLKLVRYKEDEKDEDFGIEVEHDGNTDAVSAQIGETGVYGQKKADWKYEWTKLEKSYNAAAPGEDPDYKDYIYKVEETNITYGENGTAATVANGISSDGMFIVSYDDDGKTVTNKLNDTSITVKKVWMENGQEVSDPTDESITSIEVKLMRKNVDPVQLDADTLLPVTEGTPKNLILTKGE